MRRVVLAFVATAIGLALLLSFKTHSVTSPLASVVGSPPEAISRKIDVAYLTASVSPTTTTPKKKAATTTKAPTSAKRTTVVKATTTTVAPKKTIKTTTTTVAPKKTVKTPAKPVKKTTTKKTVKKTTVTTVVNGPHNVAGSIVTTQYGKIQVQITVNAGKITNATVLKVPDQDDLDREINDSAVPILNAEVVARQSATLDAISGATYTYAGYVQSLQAAIDAAKL